MSKEINGIEEQHAEEGAEQGAEVIFLKEAERTLRELCEQAREKNELAFVRTIATDLWNPKMTAQTAPAEAQMLFNGYLMFLDEGELTEFRVRLMLGLYGQLARGAAYYDIPSNLLAIADGGTYRDWPFPVSDPELAGGVLGYLADLSARNGRMALAGVFRDLFDQELVAGYARADYVLNEEGIHLLNRHGGAPRLVSLPEFFVVFERAVNYFEMLRLVIAGYLTKYQRGKQVTGRDAGVPERSCHVKTDLRNRRLLIDG